jgi:hypothetical protein
MIRLLRETKGWRCFNASGGHGSLIRIELDLARADSGSPWDSINGVAIGVWFAAWRVFRGRRTAASSIDEPLLLHTQRALEDLGGRRVRKMEVDSATLDLRMTLSDGRSLEVITTTSEATKDTWQDYFVSAPKLRYGVSRGLVTVSKKGMRVPSVLKP